MNVKLHLKLSSIFILMFFTMVLFQNCNSFEANNTIGADFNSVNEEQGQICEAESLTAVNPQESIRLSKKELILTFKSFMNSKYHLQIEQMLQPLPEITTLSYRNKNLISYGTLESNLDIFYKIAKLIAEDEASLDYFSNCDSSLKSCFDKRLRVFVKKIHRKGVEDVDIEKYTNLAEKINSTNFVNTYIVTLTQFFISPYFIYRLEKGSSGQGFNLDKVKLTPYEVANRLSYQLTSAPPDNELFLAAEKNELDTLAKIKVHGDRLILKKEFKDNVLNFFSLWFESNTKVKFPNFDQFLSGDINKESLVDDMRGEFNDFINQTIFTDNGTVTDLYVSDKVNPKNKNMSLIYGVAANSGVARSPNRGGLLNRPIFLLSSTTRSSIINRGVFVRRHILCDQLPSPGSDVINKRNEDEISIDKFNLSNRALVESDTGGSCMGCHNRINSLGYALENFDSIGRYRTEEKIFNDQGLFLKNHPIIPSVDIEFNLQEVSNIEGPSSFNQQLANHPSVQACFNAKVLSYMRKKDIDKNKNKCFVESISNNSSDEKLSVVERISRSVINSTIFWKNLK